VKNRATAANILGRIPDFRAISIENREIHDGSRYQGTHFSRAAKSFIFDSRADFNPRGTPLKDFFSSLLEEK